MVKIRDKILEVPIIQGGMGVGVSLSSLAGSVAKCGAMGVISAAHPGYNYPDFNKNVLKTNLIALKDHLKRARLLSQGRGLIGVNIMVAGYNYEQYVQGAIEGGCDAIISGAGLPLDLPKYAKDKALLAPIVSSGKAISLILRFWDKKYQCTPDFVVIEGAKAGGHLGFSKKDLLANTYQRLEDILQDVLKELDAYILKYKKQIPVFVAGGISSSKEFVKMLKLGACGIQVATPFIATKECDASDEFKQMIVDCKKEDIDYVTSPAGFPGRAIVNDFVKKIREQGLIKVTNCIRCIQPCDPKATPYCISQALINSVKGNVNQGLVFVGEQAARIKEIKTVREVIQEYMEEVGN